MKNKIKCSRCGKQAIKKVLVSITCNSGKIVKEKHTLCSDCLKLWERRLSDSQYKIKILDLQELAPCKKCGGLGYIARFAHIESGKCYACNGSGKSNIIR